MRRAARYQGRVAGANNRVGSDCPSVREISGQLRWRRHSRPGTHFNVPDGKARSLAGRAPGLKRILLITDLPIAAEDAAVEGLFRQALRLRFEVDVVYHDRTVTRAERRGDVLVVPKSALRHGLVKQLHGSVAGSDYDYVVIRNKYHVLRQMLRSGGPAKVGFWETFPHSYRRVAEAELKRQAVWRKRLEYAWRRRRELALLRRADFLLAISVRHVAEFHPAFRGPLCPLPTGLDATALTPRTPVERTGPTRLVYVGTMDLLRQVELVNAALLQTPEDFRLDYYTFSQNPSVDAIRACRDPRVRVLPALPRQQLFAALGAVDVGLSFVPETRTYIGSSPTKTLEYAALGLAVMANPLPDYEEWLDPAAAFLTPFNAAGIQAGLRRVLATPRSVLLEMGRRNAQRVRERRSYGVLAERVAEFLERL